MKKVVYFLLALVLVGLGACDNEPKFKVQGEVKGAADKTLYLEASALEGIVLLDSYPRSKWAYTDNHRFLADRLLHNRCEASSSRRPLSKVPSKVHSRWSKQKPPMGKYPNGCWN